MLFPLGEIPFHTQLQNVNIRSEGDMEQVE